MSLHAVVYHVILSYFNFVAVLIAANYIFSEHMHNRLKKLFYLEKNFQFVNSYFCMIVNDSLIYTVCSIYHCILIPKKNKINILLMV